MIESQIPKCPTTGKSHVMPGSGHHTMANGKRERATSTACDAVEPRETHTTSACSHRDGGTRPMCASSADPVLCIAHNGPEELHRAKRKCGAQERSPPVLGDERAKDEYLRARLAGLRVPKRVDARLRVTVPPRRPLAYHGGSHAPRS